MALPYKSPKKILAELLENYMGYQQVIKDVFVCHTPYDSRYMASFPCSVMDLLGIANTVNESFAVFGDTRDGVLSKYQLIRMDIPEEQIQKIIMNCDNAVDALNAVVQAIVLSNREAKTQYMGGMMRLCLPGDYSICQPSMMEYIPDADVLHFMLTIGDKTITTTSSDKPIVTDFGGNE